MYDGLLLDHDGVVVTLGDRDALVDAAATALRDAGVADPAEEAVDALSVTVDDSDLVDVSHRYGLDPDDLWRHRDDRVDEALREEATTGRKAPYEGVTALRAVDVPLGVVSNNQTRVVESVLEHYELRGLFDTIRARAPTHESLTRKKPRPTYLEEAMADLAVENPLYVGDSESDVEAGQRAGVDTAFLRRPHNAETSLATAPTYEVEGLDEVVALLDRHPRDRP